jgi:flagella basal body P-ring formation protein FlgA
MRASIHTVMPGLVPGIHVLLSKTCRKEDVDGRDKPGHDEKGSGSLRRALARAIILALGLAAAVPAAAQVRIAATEPRPALKAEAAVAGPLVRIGDLVAHAGVVADVAIFRAPDLGHTGMVATARVIEAIRVHRLSDIDTGGIAEVAVTRTSRVIAVKQIEARIAAAFAGQHGLGDAKDLAVSFEREARPIHVEPAAAGELTLAHASFERAAGRFEVTFELPGSGAGERRRLRYAGTIAETVQAAVLTRQLARGETIAANDVAIERRPKGAAGANALQTLEQVAGFAARRALRAGEPLRASDVMRPEIVRQNETVTLLYEMPGIFLSVRGKAVESGAEGDLVNVVNPQSKRTVQGTVTGPGRVTVVSMTPRVMAAEADATASIPRAAAQPPTE